jgi:uncharacterized SAM-binding protein YcdF (DUF218 family)
VARALLLLVSSLVLFAGCGARYEVRPTPPTHFDVVIVPGCPNEDDGSLSLCQMSRAVWASLLWQRGVTGAFITSGGAVHSRYVEAEALAEAMTALGVPAERIWIEPNALHTDENMYFSLQIARALGWRSLAVASQKGHAAWSCLMLEDWGQSCGAFSVDMDAVRAAGAREKLAHIRSALARDYVPLSERERSLAARSGRRRPPSYLLYPFLGWLRLNGERWVPYAPERPTLSTWAERIRTAGR